MNRFTTSRLERLHSSRQGGFTLIEALVALVVLAIGLLGIAALNLDALRSGRTAIYRTQAINLASDMADRIRANRQGRNDYVLLLTEASPDPAITAASCETTVGCSNAEMARNDLARWRQAVAGLLPAGNGSVNVVTLGATEQDLSSYEITITWTEPGSAADDPLTAAIESPFFTMRLEI
jgi:type IV pilus assembly protein PilV